MAISIHTDFITFVDREMGPSPAANPRFNISEPDEEGMRTIKFEFKIAASDYWDLSVSKGTGDDKVVFGFGQGNTHQEHPEKVVLKSNEWQEEGERTRDEKSPNVLVFPPSFWEDR